MKDSCLHCKQALEKKQKKFCSNKCQLDYQHYSYIQRWLSGAESGMQGGEKVSEHIRVYLIHKCGNRCSMCGWDKINPVTNKVPVQIDHIDGDYTNNKEYNLRLLCPNCHSLTPNYGALNTGKGRTKRRMIRNGAVAQLGERLHGM